MGKRETNWLTSAPARVVRRDWSKHHSAQTIQLWLEQRDRALVALARKLDESKGETAC